VSLTLASVLAANEHINQTLDSPSVESEMARHSNEYIFWSVALSVDNNIGCLLQVLDVAFRRISPNGIVRLEFFHLTRTRTIPAG
jgi:hypothetical protein